VDKSTGPIIISALFLVALGVALIAVATSRGQLVVKRIFFDRPGERFSRKVARTLHWLGIFTLVVALLGGVAGVVVVNWTPAPNAEPQHSTQPSPPPTSSPPTSTSGTPLSEPPTEPTSSQPFRSAYLSDLKPLDNSSVQTPVSTSIGKDTYPHSIRISCINGRGSSASYDVHEYNRLDAKVGIDNSVNNPDAKTERCGVRVTTEAGVQLGQESVVSSGKPIDLTVDLQGAGNITITCTILDLNRGFNSGYYPLAFGNAQLSG
jgi:cytoskeletal protein RodZ